MSHRKKTPPGVRLMSEVVADRERFVPTGWCSYRYTDHRYPGCQCMYVDLRRPYL